MRTTGFTLLTCVLIAAPLGGCIDIFAGTSKCYHTCEKRECGLVGQCHCGDCTWDQICTDEGVCQIGTACELVCKGRVCGSPAGCECGRCSPDELCSWDGSECISEAFCEAECEGSECGFVAGCACGVCDEGFECLPTKELLLGVMDMFLVPDLDVDGDGTFESISYAMEFEVVPAAIAGFNP